MSRRLTNDEVHRAQGASERDDQFFTTVVACDEALSARTVELQERNVSPSRIK
jgi:hypothetical protein